MKYLFLILSLFIITGSTIDLAYIEGYRVHDTNVIRWSTRSEKDNPWYLLYRKEGETYTIIARIHGGGTSGALSMYRFEDTHPLTSYKLLSAGNDTTLIREIHIQ